MTLKLNILLLLALAFQARRVCGKEAAIPGDDNSNKDSPASELVADEPKHGVSLPAFAPFSVPKAVFWEQFSDGLEPRWKRSQAIKDGEDEARYSGEWAVEEASELLGIAGDNMLVVKSEARHHAISALLDRPFDPAQHGLVFQYEVKLQNNLNCGGAYAKLLTAPLSGEFSDATPYTLMFGPDKCGDSKVHLIYRHRNPVTGEYTQHHLKQPPTPPTDRLTHLYTLAVHTNNSFSVSIDGSEQRAGSLLEDFEPPVNPPKEIDDPNDKKPLDWEDEEKIPDPDAVKPDDWDEDAPPMVPDEDAVMPKGWLENEPLMVEDPKAEKPSDWDDDEDGDWTAPMVPNPRCAETDGCGPWKRPLKRNPDHKGKWTPPLIDNPRYTGEWAPRRIANPEYFEDLEPYKLEKIGGIGFELWTMQSGISFNNIYLGDSIDDAAQIAKNVWEPKHEAEIAVRDALNPKPPKVEKSKASELLELVNIRLADIAFSIGGFYGALQRDGVVVALRDERSGAIASAMAVGGLCWLVWNLLAFVRLFSGSATPAQTPSRTTTTKDTSADSDSNTAAEAASTSARADAGGSGVAVKRKGAKSDKS
ncbi:hypothetical protein H4R24_002720 [Coemansia sp. RSA 988]|nr:hypothetical protein H4R24_002720 [Coemansia sp. RSA 988]